MKKKAITILLALTLLCTVGGTVLASSRTVQAELRYRDIKITLDGQTLVPKDSSGAVVEPFIIDGTTYLPLRAVAEALGLEVDWDGTTSTVSLTSGGQSSGGTVDHTANAMAAYRVIVGKADSYTYSDYEPGGDVNISYRYALVQMQTQNQIPALLLFRQTEGYNVGFIYNVRVFQYDPNSQTVIEVEGTLAGGQRVGLSAASDGNGILDSDFSGGTGIGKTDRVTVNGNTLSRVTVLRQDLVDGQLYTEEIEDVDSVEIDWHGITDLSGLNG